MPEQRTLRSGSVDSGLPVRIRRAGGFMGCESVQNDGLHALLESCQCTRAMIVVSGQIERR